MKPYQIVDRYARSVFELAEEQGKSETFAHEIDVLSRAMRNQPKFLDLLENPLVTREEKRALIKNILTVEAVHEPPLLLERFLTLLVEKGRIDLFSAMARQLHNKLNEKRGVQEATAVTARRLDPNVVELLKKALEKMTAKKIVLNLQADPSLLGGVRICLGNRLLDGSLRTKLDSLDSQLTMAKV
ncbi:MAG: ATP synthase F1 subunit delta [Omnitrophica bacterium RIFCSPLOWO2_12_FULL_50_11]|nr:MAG: ATP synthase F1 subunit delta [Omnitrophica bacterium RIFCSPLOWO2_12_FULL_50_11]